MGMKSTLDAVYLGAEKGAYRAARAAGLGGDWNPAANFNIFTIAGGPVRITGMFGNVVAVFAGANATPLIAYAPASILPLVWNPLAVIAVAAAFPLASLLVWDGSLTVVTGVLRATANLGHNQIHGAAGTLESFDGGSISIMPGTIRITNAGALDNTGQVDWYITYKPLVQGATIVAIP